MSLNVEKFAQEIGEAPDTNPGGGPDVETAKPTTSSAADSWEEYFPTANEGGDASDKPAPPREVLSLAELPMPIDADGNELIRNRFLCRCGSMLLVGGTGLGKSALALQMAILWSLGRNCFDLHPTGKLRSLFIQAENDAGDLCEMRDGIFGGLKLSHEERASAGDSVLIASVNDRIGVAFIRQEVAPLLEMKQPDILWIDPLLAYLGDDVNAQSAVSPFLRTWLTPAVTKANAACVLIHHPPKPSREKSSQWNPADFAYSGAGSAELANWSRAVVALEGTARPGLFRLRLGKRGKRAGWTEADGVSPTYERTIAHGDGGLIYWREADADEEATASVPVGQSKEDVLAIVPTDKPISKDALISKAKSAKNIGRNRARGFISELIEAGLLHECLVKRPRTNPARYLARQPQPSQLEIET